MPSTTGLVQGEVAAKPSTAEAWPDRNSQINFEREQGFFALFYRWVFMSVKWKMKFPQAGLNYCLILCMWQVSWQHPSRCSSHWKQQLKKEGEEEPGLAAGRPLSTGSEPQQTSSSPLIWCSLESRQIGLQQSVWWECSEWTLSREKKPSPLWMNLHLSVFRLSSPHPGKREDLFPI